MHTHHTGLQELRHSDYQVAEDQPDIEGWAIRNGSNEVIGKVYDVLFDPAAQKVRYVIADLRTTDHHLANHQLIPIGMAVLHESSDEVLLPDVTANQMLQFAPYPYDALRNNITLGTAVPVPEAGQQYNHLHFSDDQLFSRRSGHAADKNSPPSQGPEAPEGDNKRTGGFRLRPRRR